jgi:hypothetical protein
MNFFQLCRIFFNLAKSRTSDRSDFLFTVLEWPQPEAMARADCGEYRPQGFALAKWVSGSSLHGSNPEPLMSALGQKRTFSSSVPMSALPPKADMADRVCDVRFVPKADIRRCSKSTSLFDHLVRDGEKP